MIQVIPGILEKTFEDIEKRIAQVEHVVDWVEIDVLDNTLYKNVTYNNVGAFNLFAGRVNLAAHLMVSDPLKYIEPLQKAGFKRLIADVGGDTVREFIHEAKVRQLEVGVALDGPEPIDAVEPYLEEVDTVLLMTIKSGYSGSVFLPSVLPKIKKIHELFPALPIEVDGGIDKQTAPLCIENGATRLVSTSFLFWKNPDRITEAIEELGGGSAFN